MGRRILVVGAGMGGLALALRLAHRGNQVTVLEKTGQIGGRNRREQVGSCHFDGGPTLLMMLDPFRKLFEDVGERFEEQVPIRLCDPSYRVFFRDGTRFDGTTNVELMTERIRALAGDRDADRYPAFLTELEALYRESIPHFVRRNYRSLADFASPAQVKRVLRHRMLANLGRRVERRFRDPRLAMLFSFQTMYLGLSPFDAPWVYATLAYMEYGEGIYYPRGGLPALSERVAGLAQERGAEIRLNAPVARIEGNSVVLESGERLTADAVVANADLPYVQRDLERRPRPRRYRNSCSAYLMYIDYEGDLEGFEHHNVLFGRDFKDNLDALFHRLRIPQDPAFYVCISKRSDPGVAPDGRINLFVLVPCPNLELPFDDTAAESLERSVFQRLCEEGGFDPANIRAIHRRGPHEWQSELNLDRGAAFGISHDLFQSAFFRPQNRSRANGSLYYVGASTVPGNGLPMVLISAELAEQRLLDDGVIV
jgi:phytoene desaturase